MPLDAAVVPERSVVETAKSRSPPSFSAYDVRSFIGHGGHGVTSSGRRRRRLADELDLGDRRGAFAVRVRDAVGAGVAAADHDHVLPGGGDRVPPARGGAPATCGPSSRATQRLRW